MPKISLKFYLVKSGQVYWFAKVTNMYINNDLCPYQIRKEENKCGRIFRPWDNQIAKNAFRDTSQDCTVSTTTKDEELAGKIEEQFKDKNVFVQEKTCSSPIKRKASAQDCNNSVGMSSPSSHTGCSSALKTSNSHQSPVLEKCLNNNLESHSLLYSTPLPIDYLQDPYTTLNTDLVQSNLAQHLGLPPNDPLLLESLAQGYALEEYARVLSQEQQAKLMAAKKQRPKKYKCPHCDVGFSNNGQLKGHIRIHTGERPFKCDEKECGKTFTRNEELTRHKRIHSGLRPFPCSHCGKRFGRKDHLKKHSRTHFQPRGLYAVPVVLPFEAWASGQTNGYPFFPVMY